MSEAFPGFYTDITVHNLTLKQWVRYSTLPAAGVGKADVYGHHRLIYDKGVLVEEQNKPVTTTKHRARDDPLGLLRIRIQRSPKENMDNMVVFTEEETFDRVDLALDRMAELEGQKAALELVNIKEGRIWTVSSLKSKK